MRKILWGQNGSWVKWVLGLVLLVAGILIGRWWAQVNLSNSELLFGTQLRDAESGFSLISPLLAYKSPDKSLFKEYRGLARQLAERIKQAKDDDTATEISVYFRNLRNGHWTGVNEEQEYVPASMFKVPVMIAILRQSEGSSAVLSQKVQYRQVSNTPSDNYNSAVTTQLKYGQFYTVKRLIEAMIIDSDNNAKELLLDVVDMKILADVFHDLEMDVVATELKGEAYRITPRQYSLLFRILYNATWLNDVNSEWALELLSRTTFDEGLTAKLPDTIKVAHKFGIKQTGENTRELHDCGIVYNADEPYFVCVMTQGKDYGQLARVIGDLSGLVYRFVKH